MADSLNLVAVLGAVLAIFLLFIVFAEKSGMLESMYPVKKHPSANAFVQLVLAEIILLATVCIGTKYDGKESSCRVMGMLTHFFSLASVAWTCLITGDMYLRSKVVVENPGLPTGLRHSLVAKNAMIVANIAWTIPAVVVLIVGVRTESGCGKINGNEYGGDGFCWIIASKTMVWSYVLLIVLLSIAAIYFAAAWFIMMAAASDNGVISPKLCARIETDLTGCILTFVSGIIAFTALGFVDADNPASTESAQVVFGVGVVIHAVVLVYFFVALPAMAKGTWNAVASRAVSPDGSLGSISMASAPVPGVAGYGVLPRGMALPSQNPMAVNSASVPPDNFEQRRVLGASVQYSLNELTHFARKLRQAAPVGRITFAQFLDTYEKALPNKVEHPIQYAKQVFLLFDAEGVGSVDVHQVLLTMAGCSFSTLEEQLNAIFTLYDPDGKNELTYDELFDLVKRIMTLDETTSSVDWLRQQDVTDMLHLDARDDNSDGGVVTRQQFSNVAYDEHGILCSILQSLAPQ
eukprot:m.295716 g.295716  ORF g.295716 m.295716 type:complete len:520 (+) comp20046_c0_seq3:191-1750(+)